MRFGWAQNPRPDEFVGGCNQSLQVGIALADCVSQEAYGCGVRGNMSVTLGDDGSALANRIRQFATTVMAVHVTAEPVARGHVRLLGRTHGIAGAASS